MATRTTKSASANRNGWSGYAVCVLIGLAAAQPILVTGRLPQGHDAIFHLHRLVQLDALVRQGILYSRWAPDLARGFGYPLFNYYGPLSYYLPEALHLLGVPFVPALLTALTLSLIVSALAMYLWARDILGEAPGILAAAAYAFSPYLMLNLTLRTVLAEEWALALLPLVLFSANRLFSTYRFGYVVLLSLCLAALILCHNVTVALFMPFFMAYIALLTVTTWLAQSSPVANHKKKAAVRSRWACLAVLLGIGLSAFFSLPALAERNLVQMNRLTNWSVFFFHLNYEPLERVFSPPVLDELHLVSRSIPHSLSIVATGLAVVGLLGIWRWRPARTQIAQISFAVLATCAAVFMALPASLPVWSAFPAMHILQFPWRFLGIASMFLALVAGAALRVIQDRIGRLQKWAALTVPLSVGLLFAWSFTWQYVHRFHADLGHLSIDDVVGFERITPYVGTTTTGEYLPITVEKYPPPEQNTSGYDHARFDPSSMPEGAQVVSASYEALDYSLSLETPSAFVAVFRTFDFAGWQAWVDGIATPITPTTPYGLISVAVPAGKHEIRLRFGTTPVRALGEAISLVSLTLLIGTVALRKVRSQRGPQISPFRYTHPGLPPSLLWSTTGVLVLAFAAKTLYVDHQLARYRRTRFPIVANTSFADQVILMGADQPQAARSGGQAKIVLYWRVPRKTNTEYSSSVQLVNAQGLLLSQADSQHPGDYPTTIWDTEDYVRDPHDFTVPPGTPPGRYTLRVSVYPYGKPTETLDVLDSGGAPAGRSLDLTTLEVTHPERPPREEQLGIATRLDHTLGRDLVLLGCNLPTRTARTGERLPFTLYWKAIATPNPGLTVQLQMLDAGGTVVHRLDVSPVPGYDTALWQPGDLWYGMQTLTIPPHLSGRYTLAIGREGQPAVPLTTLDILAPEHVRAAPQTRYTEAATFGNLVSLVGYDMTDPLQPGQVVTVTLVWRVERETQTEYKTFVHLLDADGRLLAGSDMIPGNWQRPSTSWVVGEYIIEAHSLLWPQDLPAGSYPLEVGLYDSATMERLLLSNGTNSLILSQSLQVRCRQTAAVHAARNTAHEEIALESNRVPRCLSPTHDSAHIGRHSAGPD